MSQSYPLASVVVNNYNYGRYLAEAIDSALAQTYRPLEVVVVDDGSTDDSRDIIAGYGARVVPVLQSNGGQGSALNAGFAASRGEVVLFLDADDVLLPTAVETAAAHLRDAGVAKVHWPLWETDAAGARTGRVVPDTPLPEGDLRDAVVREGPLAGSGAPTSGNAWSRRFLERVLPMPEQELTRHADSYLNTLACLHGHVRRVDEPQACYRVHGSNDYASEPSSEKLRRNLEMYHYRCRLLSTHLRADGVDVQPATWKSGNPRYEQFRSRYAATLDIAAIVPSGEVFVLVDDGAWGDGVVIAGRYNVRFPERGGPGDTRPRDVAAVILELERLRDERGAGFIAFVRPALWWLRSHPKLDRHLRSRYYCVLATDWTVVFDLRT